MAFQLDLDGPSRRILKASGRLFSLEDGFLEVFSIARYSADTEREKDRIRIEKAEEFTASVNEVNKTLKGKVSTWIFYMDQGFTWSPFKITAPLFSTLTSHINPSPTFLDIVQIFGEKPGPVEEGFTLYFENFIPNFDGELRADERCSFELGYTIKYVERHGRQFLDDPFSIRETGVYHKWDTSTEQHTWVFLEVSKTTKEGVERLCLKLPELKQFQLHVGILLAASENWRYYTNYLEMTFSTLIHRGSFTEVKSPVHDGDVNVKFSNVQDFHILTDKLRRISHILMLNMNVGSQIQRFVRRLKSAWLPLDFTSSSAFDECEAKIDEFLFAHRTHKGRIDLMLERSRGISGLIRTRLEFRAVDLSREINSKNREISENVHEITRQGAQKKLFMKHLAYQSTHDTRALKIIALITAIFLPATLVATLFGSNFFGFQTSNGSARLQIASNFWIYIVATVTLLCGTIPAWWWCFWVSRSPRSDKKMNSHLFGLEDPA